MVYRELMAVCSEIQVFPSPELYSIVAMAEILRLQHGSTPCFDFPML